MKPPCSSVLVAVALALCHSPLATAQTPPVAPPSIAPSQPVFHVAPEPPPLSDEDVALLVKSVRAALRDELAGQPERAPGYRPQALKGVRQILHVTLRRDGAAVAETETKEIDLVDGAVAAGVMLGRVVKGKKMVLAEHGDRCGLELEWLGPIEYVTATNDEQGKWTDALLHCFEPGREGIGVEMNGRQGRMRPSQIIVLNLSPDLALQGAEKAAEVTMLDKTRHAKDVRYFRFRTRHVWQAHASVRRPVNLVRCEQLIPTDAVTKETLDAAIHRMGRYLKYRQNSDGWYSEEYLPSPDRYAPGNSAVLQMHALHGLAMYASWSKDEAMKNAAAKGIMRSATFLTPLIVPKWNTRLGGETSAPTTSPTTSAPIATTQAGHVLAFPGHGDHLLVTARMLLSMMELGERPEFAEIRPQLVEAILASQDEDGRFEMIFERTEPRVSASGVLASENALAAGVGMQALARAATEPRASASGFLAALQRAERHYHHWYEQANDSTAASEICRALAQGYVTTNDARASDLAFRFLDELIGLQVTAQVTPWPELIGAIDTKQPGLVGIDTASYLLAISDGLELARRIGDTKRVKRYQSAVHSAAKFVMQLEITDSGAFYARSKVDTVGGVRRSPWNNIIRSDNASEAVMSLIAARRAIFPSN